MERFLARCIADTTIEGIQVGMIYKVEYSVCFKIIYNETDETYLIVAGNGEWFYQHFEPLRCINCTDKNPCSVYKSGREYACYGYQQVRDNI